MGRFKSWLDLSEKEWRRGGGFLKINDKEGSPVKALDHGRFAYRR